MPDQSGWLNRRYRRARARLHSVLWQNDFAQSFPARPLSTQFGHREARKTDISDHLSDLFFDVMSQAPRLIVELGTRGGESTRVLLAAAEQLGARVLSVDLNDCSQVTLSDKQRQRWTFVQSDDVAFGKTGFAGWCEEQQLPVRADVIFLDTSHYYEHTLEELRAWVPHVPRGGLLILHDTNMGRGLYRRFDNSMGSGWNNQRGVIRAVEEYVGRKYDEATLFCDITGEFLIRHRPNCNGYTVIKRLP
jgi:cephalosporin hydroxylase